MGRFNGISGARSLPRGCGNRGRGAMPAGGVSNANRRSLGGYCNCSSNLRRMRAKLMIAREKTDARPHSQVAFRPVTLTLHSSR